MKVSENIFEHLNQQIQQLPVSAKEAFAQGSRSELFDEFSRILDKIAAKVQNIQENQAHNIWNADKALFAGAELAKKEQTKEQSNAKQVTDNKHGTELKAENETTLNHPPKIVTDKPVKKADTDKSKISSAHVEKSTDLKVISEEKVVVENTDVSQQEAESNAKSDAELLLLENQAMVGEGQVQDVAAPDVFYATTMTVPSAGNSEKFAEHTDENLTDAQESSKPEGGLAQETTDNLTSSTKTKSQENSSLLDAGVKTSKSEFQKDQVLLDPGAQLLSKDHAKTSSLPDDFTQKVMERLLQKFNDKGNEAVKLESPAAQFARLVVDLAMPIKIGTQQLTSALGLNQAAAKQAAEVSLANKVVAIVTNNPSNSDGAQTLLNSNARRAEKQEETQRLPKSFASRTLTKVEEALREVARSKDGKTISLRLDPPQLGQVKIDVSIRDGVLSAKLRADNPQVALLLREHGHDLQGALRRLGLAVDEIKIAVQGNEFDNESEFNNFMNQSNKENDNQQFNWNASEQTIDLQNKIESSEDVVSEDHWVA